MRLLLIGGTVVEVYKNEKRLKASISEYLKDLTRAFEKVNWMTLGLTTERVSELVGKVPNDGFNLVLIRNKGICWWSMMREYWRYQKESDIILLFLPTGLPLTLLTCMVCKRKIVVVYLAGDYNSQTKNLDFAKRHLYRLLMKINMKVARGVIARGKLLSLLARKYNSNVLTTVALKHSFARENVDAANRFQCSRVLYVGKILLKKGLELLVEAFKDIKHNAVLTIVGNGADMNNLRRMKFSSREGRRIELVGWVDSSDQLEAIYDKSTVLVMPSFPEYGEGVPRVIEEALDMGLPVVATKVGGIDLEFDDEFVYKVDPYEKDQLVDAITYFLTDRYRYIEYVNKILIMWNSNLKDRAGLQHARFMKDL